MVKLLIKDIGEFFIEKETKLVLAIQDNNGDINHACGGNARCTTCKVKFIDGEPQKYTQAEYDKLLQEDAIGEYRLSCQCTVDHDMSVIVLENHSTSNRPDPGSRPHDNITPPPTWISNKK